ncbi:ABC-type multidrug transport system fused ATPase/permease subunit [Chelatococcus caeni]|uniref:ABC-type multidrug transport system fused ATPase/permease subunit n=1 Tax=Chelatococcus caeni TaxID=1348468 RepID=A0A840BVI7_9HYPH|nr:ABC transporter ATP-binding protein [Chelatococcus caeni]MBB4016994.1 ABC-type multidrug transport system fused ATPase/permease subunit [Chelatococcus caeni]
MERDPLRLAWRSNRGLNLVIALVGLLLAVAVLLFLGVLATLIDDVLIGGRFADIDAQAPFLRLAFGLPAVFGGGEVVVSEGILLGRDAYMAAAIATLIALILLQVGLRALVSLLAATAASRATNGLRKDIFGRIVTARPSARDEAEAAARQIGEGVGRLAPVLREALAVPLSVGPEILVILAFGFAQHLSIGLLFLGGAIAAAVLMRPLDEARAALGLVARDGDRESGRMAQEAARRLPAIRIHGTGEAELAGFGAMLARLSARQVAQARRQIGLQALVAIVRYGLPALFIVIAGNLAAERVLSAGGFVAALFAAFLMLRPVDALTRWIAGQREGRAALEELARAVGSLNARGERRRRAARLPQPSPQRVGVEGLTAFDPHSGHRLEGVDLTLDLPAHVALAGPPGSGADVLAAVLGGALDPTEGRVLFDGVDVGEMSDGYRAAVIAFAGADPVMLDGSLRDNLTYGVPPDLTRDKDACDARLIAALKLVGVDAEVYSLGLNGAVGAHAAARLAPFIADARRAVREELASDGTEDLVDPFAAERYNRHGTVAENILFGVPVGDTFEERRLARNPFLRAVLEAEDLTRPLTEMGLAIATQMVEMFAGIPDDNALIERFSFFSAEERGRYEGLIARRAQRRRSEQAEDRDLLIALALRYVETRHRLGLLDEALEARLVAARRTFARLLPPGLAPAIEFWEAERLCSAASLSDNLLFGRVAYDIAGAEERVHAAVRRVLASLDLDAEVLRLGLSARVGPRKGLVSPVPDRLVDLIRCLAREPQVLVVSHIFDGMTRSDAEALIGRLRQGLENRSLVAVLPPGLPEDCLDRTVHFSRAGLALPRAEAEMADGS